MAKQPLTDAEFVRQRQNTPTMPDTPSMIDCEFSARIADSPCQVERVYLGDVIVWERPPLADSVIDAALEDGR